jgi:hypothetical protein
MSINNLNIRFSDLVEGATTPACPNNDGEVLRTYVGHMRFQSDTLRDTSQDDFAGGSIAEVEQKGMGRTLLKRIAYRKASAMGLPILVAIALYFNGFIAVYYVDLVLVGCLSFVLTSVSLEYPLLRKLARGRLETHSKQVTALEFFVDRYGPDTPPFRLCDFEYDLSNLEKMGIEPSAALKAWVDLLRKRNDETPIGALMV